MSREQPLPELSQELLLRVAEELKLPLLQIARHAEYGALDAATIHSTADAALRLLDNYTLAVRLQTESAVLEREAVSISSVLYDSGQELSALARSYGVELELHVAGRYETVMANRAGLQAALVSLGASLIEALPALANSGQLKLELATHRSRYGIVAGVYTDSKQLSHQALRRGRSLHATSRQPFNQLTHTGAAGIFIADSILQAMDLELTASRHRKLYGFGTVLQPNHQLQLV